MKDPTLYWERQLKYTMATLNMHLKVQQAWLENMRCNSHKKWHNSKQAKARMEKRAKILMEEWLKQMPLQTPPIKYNNR